MLWAFGTVTWLEVHTGRRGGLWPVSQSDGHMRCTHLPAVCGEIREAVGATELWRTGVAKDDCGKTATPSIYVHALLVFVYH
jgi:hypothetical protein